MFFSQHTRLINVRVKESWATWVVPREFPGSYRWVNQNSLLDERWKAVMDLSVLPRINLFKVVLLLSASLIDSSIKLNKTISIWIKKNDFAVKIPVIDPSGEVEEGMAFFIGLRSHPFYSLTIVFQIFQSVNGISNSSGGISAIALGVLFFKERISTMC